MSGKNLVILLFVLLLLATAAVIYATKKRKERNKEINDIVELINSNTGIEGEDIKQILFKSAPAAVSDAKALAEKIKNAKGYINDSEDDVYEVLAGKTKGQLKTIQTTFQNSFGDLDDFLKGWMSSTEYNKVLTIVKSSK